MKTKHEIYSEIMEVLNRYKMASTFQHLVPGGMDVNLTIENIKQEIDLIFDGDKSAEAQNIEKLFHALDEINKRLEILENKNFSAESRECKHPSTTKNDTAMDMYVRLQGGFRPVTILPGETVCNKCWARLRP